MVLSWHQSQQRIQIFSVIRNITFLAGQLSRLPTRGMKFNTWKLLIFQFFILKDVENNYGQCWFLRHEVIGNHAMAL